ncbi:Isochorismatase-like protein [Exophiala viscosa]|uniref:Isochorismatase-like protein n=1 Tax=Exophiala viscosa TaxID=2486360 RepID=A0AAN6DS66_9EURO|nr:Isochorismatase-like protein [Exophiala viscosa]KAI1628699.1 Isochorismatase-like protein [Exophiala viscosa]
MTSSGKATFSPSDASSPLSISPAETALLLIDYQNLILPRLGDAAPSVLNVASQMRDWAISKSVPIYHCLIDTRPGVKPPMRSKMSTRWRLYEEKLAAMPTLGDEADVLAVKGTNLLERTAFRTPGIVSALESTGLKAELYEKQIKSLLICGLSTSGAVLSTTRAASDQGFIVTVVEDACFDPVPGLHGMLVNHVLPTTAHVATASEVRDAWRIL